KESTRVPTGKNKHNYEIDDNRRIMELELPKNCGKVFKDQVAYFEKVLVTNNELLELSASIRQSKTKRIQDLEKTYKHLTHRFEEKFTDLMNQKKEKLELLEHLKGRVIQFEKICDV
ncbi:3480_t:CDS:2, partial [Paraglomus brasilianum]